MDESSIFQETVPGKDLDSMHIGKLLGGLIWDTVSRHNRKTVLVSDSEEGVKTVFCRFLSATATSRKQNKWIGRKVLSWVSRTGRDPGLHVAITCLGSRQEIYLLQDHHVNQRDAFWQVPQVSNVVVQKIILTKEKEKRTNKLNRDFWSQSQPNCWFPTITAGRSPVQQSCCLIL